MGQRPNIEKHDYAEFKSLRLLLVCESFSPKASGGLVAIRLASVMRGIGANVQVFCTGRLDGGDRHIAEIIPDNFGTVPSLVDDYLPHLIRARRIKDFQLKLRELRPDIVHFASFDYSKPRFLIDASLRSGARVVLQPWIHGFYCGQGYGFLRGNVCGLCASGNVWHSIRHRCMRPHRIMDSIGRVLLRRDAIRSHAVLSTNQHLDGVLRSYGVSADRIIRTPLPFDPARVEGFLRTDGERFIFYGQPKEFKGIRIVSDIVDRCPEAGFEVYPFGRRGEVCFYPNLMGCMDGRVVLDENVRWHTGLAQRIAGSRGVLIPSLWPSTTEYSLLEAMGLGKPVIAFNVGAHHELMIHRENALVVPAGDVDSYAAAVLEVNRDPDLRRHLGQKARNTFELITSAGALIEPLRRAYFG